MFHPVGKVCVGVGPAIAWYAMEYHRLEVDPLVSSEKGVSSSFEI